MEQKDKAHPVTAREMMAVLNQMSSSPVAMFLKNCSEQQKMMIAAMVRCVRREGVPEISWRSVSDTWARLALELIRIIGSDRPRRADAVVAGK